MKQFLLICTVIFLAALVNVNAMATSFGNNITIPDKNSTDTEWHGSQEDQEVEPGMSTGQGWDLEGFFLKGTTLTMVGGFDFINGNSGYNSGDIFIDIDRGTAINGGAVYGDIHGLTDGYNPVSNTFGYDYVLDLDFSTWTYNVYAIDKNATVITAFYKQNQGSSPWRYETGGTPLGSFDLTYLKDMTNKQVKDRTDEEVNFLGGNHNAVSVSLAFLQIEKRDIDFISHFTMGCGNDNLMGEGKFHANPEPATLILMGFGLIGLAGLGRKKLAKR